MPQRIDSTAPDAAAKDRGLVVDDESALLGKRAMGSRIAIDDLGAGKEVTGPAPSVLIVDDDAQNRRLFESLLRSEGYRIRAAASGEEALAAVAAEAPDLILLDVMMAGMSGLAVAKALKGDPATSIIPIIMVTGDNDRSVRLSGLDAGAEDFVNKPVDRVELWLRVRNLLRLKTLTSFFQDHSSILEAQVQQRTAALQASLKEREVLLKEVHHRVNNNMQIITSLLRLEAARADQAGTRRVLKDMQNRILAMAALHEVLYRSGNFAEIELRSYLEQLVRQLQRSLIAPSGPAGSYSGRIAFKLDLTPATVSLEEAAPCGLIVNELVSNALKHGFPEGRSGEILVELHNRGENQLRLSVSDDGVGLPDGLMSQSSRSLGLQLVSDLARQLGGELSVGPGPKAIFEVDIALRRASHEKGVTPCA